MRRDIDKNCPLKLLSEHSKLVCPQQACRQDLDGRLKEYFAPVQSGREPLRNGIFFRLSPILLKFLHRYCIIRPDCRKNCLVGDLLSDAYIAFTEYLDQFDDSRHVDFIDYVITKLSWRIYNSFARKQRCRTREIFWDEEKDGSLEEARDSTPLENSLMSAFELERYLARMKSKTRALFLLHDFFGYSYRELAVVKKQKAATLRKAVSRARRKIAKHSKNALIAK
jgi:RNA polymerase sigma factor (sigma-70 family)